MASSAAEPLSLASSSSSLLPSKKRKASHGSSSTNSVAETGGGVGEASRTETAPSSSAPGSVVSAPVSGTASSSAASISHAAIADNRLPSKKRKGSYSETTTSSSALLLHPGGGGGVELGRRRKASCDLSVSFEDEVLNRSARKGSIDSWAGLDGLLPRKLSHDSVARSEDILGALPEPLALLKQTPSLTLDTLATGSAVALGLETLEVPALTEATSTSKNGMPPQHSLSEVRGTSSTSEPGAPENEKAKVKNPAGTASSSNVAAAPDDNSSHASSGQKLLLEAIMLNHPGAGGSHSGGGSGSATFEFSSRHWGALPGGGRDRLESWGGMSDLSVPIGSSDSVVAAAYAASSSYHAAASVAGPATLDLGDDNTTLPPMVVDPLAGSTSSGLQQHILQDSKSDGVPSRITTEQRSRLDSIASLSEWSLSNPNHAIYFDGIDFSGAVAVAMASVGDQLAELADTVEAVAVEFLRQGDVCESEASSVASPMIGASLLKGQRPRSWSTSSGKISFDMQAIQAAVDAGDAASGALGLSSMASAASTHSEELPDQKKSAAPPKLSYSSKRQLPVKRARTESQPDSTESEDVEEGENDEEDDDDDEPIAPPCRINGRKSTLSEKERDRIRERTRAAVGFTASSKSPSTKKRLPPIKKRAKRNSPEPEKARSSSPIGTPKVSNKTLRDVEDVPEALLPPSADQGDSFKGPAEQKWDGMYEALMDFVDDRREEATKDMSKEEKEGWVWDGNVPTTFKTKDGKKLGRWVNNQRTAKSKGSLRKDREDRLINAGLKWSVLSSNAWNEMLEQLQIYIKEQANRGKAWDGNVPTNYQIKIKPGDKFAGEDKNLGRWVNRQRCLFHGGKLRDDRKQALEDIGLKWSMLTTASWESMFDYLLEYIDLQKKKNQGRWDGNVPANYETCDDPPRKLGRWINRQRTAYVKKKLKKEHVDKLTKIGLRWCIHNRQVDRPSADDDAESMESNELPPDRVESNKNIPDNQTRADKVESAEAAAASVVL